ncbi:hypothetical protein D3C85_1869170 [compost metagenome]
MTSHIGNIQTVLQQHLAASDGLVVADVVKHHGSSPQLAMRTQNQFFRHDDIRTSLDMNLQMWRSCLYE